MPTSRECVCCRECPPAVTAQPEGCVTEHADFSLICLQPAVLRVAFWALQEAGHNPAQGEQRCSVRLQHFDILLHTYKARHRRHAHLITLRSRPKITEALEQIYGGFLRHQVRVQRCQLPGDVHRIFLLLPLYFVATEMELVHPKGRSQCVDGVRDRDSIYRDHHPVFVLDIILHILCCKSL